MKNLWTLLAFSLISGISQASPRTTYLECDFTEPFITLNIDLVKKRVTATSFNYENPANPSQPGTIVIAERIQVSGIGSNPYFKNAKISGPAGLIATISYSGEASNGMSDGIYPYDITWTKLGLNTGACTSNLLKTKEQK